MTTIHLVSNSPGEVTTFARPVATALRRKHPDWNLQLCLVPCPYATGAEARIIQEWPEKVQVWTPWETTKAWLRGEGKGKEGAVVFLGGDPWHALLLKHRFQQPCVAYFPEESGWEETRWLGGFDRVARGYRPPEADEGQKALGIGDLRIDAVRARLGNVSSQQQELTLAIFPGSRWMHLKAVLGPFLRTLELISQQLPEVRFLLAVSPFVARDRFVDAASRPLRLGLECSTGTIEGDLLVTAQGTPVHLCWGNPYQVMSDCDLALSLPGTNVAELAIAGKPAVIPLSYRVPVGGGGLLGIIDRLPGFERLKHKLHESKKKRYPLLALPNMLAGRMILPEMFVDDDMANLADFLVELLRDESRRKAIGNEAREVMGGPGAGARVVELIEQAIVYRSYSTQI